MKFVNAPFCIISRHFCFHAVPVDPMPVWRKIIWSLDNNLIALAMRYARYTLQWSILQHSFAFYTYACTCSNGEALVLTRLGKVVFRSTAKVSIEDVSRATFSDAVAGMAFLPPERMEEEGRLVKLGRGGGYCIVLSPDPTPKRRKGSGDIGTDSWFCKLSNHVIICIGLYWSMCCHMMVRTTKEKASNVPRSFPHVAWWGLGTSRVA